MKTRIPAAIVAFQVGFAILLAGFRIYGEKGEVFQAAAHLYVGWLFGAWWLSYDSTRIEVNSYRWRYTVPVGHNARYITMALFLCFVEVACFVHSVL